MLARTVIAQALAPDQNVSALAVLEKTAMQVLAYVPVLIAQKNPVLVLTAIEANVRVEISVYLLLAVPAATVVAHLLLLQRQDQMENQRLI